MTRFDPNAAGHLEYAARSRSLRRRRILTLLGVIILLCAVTPFAVRYTRMGLERVRVTRLYRQCATHAPPATTVVWEEDPHLLSQLRDHALTDARAGAEAAYLVPDAWRQLNAALGRQIQSTGTLFLHERRTPARGQPRLVGVDIAGWSRGGPVVLFARVRALSPAVPFRLPREEKVDHPSVRLSATEGNVRLFAGQPDPNDASHFTIEYTVGEQRSVMDGWLKDDGSVVLETRSP